MRTLKLFAYLNLYNRPKSDSKIFRTLQTVSLPERIKIPVSNYLFSEKKGVSSTLCFTK
jgi:hypothetical protein